MMSIQALREQRETKAKELHALASKAEWKAAVDQPIYDAGMSEIEALDSRIKNIIAANEKFAEDALEARAIEAGERVGKDKKSPAAAAFAAWLRNGTEGINAEDRARVFATMGTQTGTQGGFTVQTDIATSVIDLLKLFGGMRAVATTIRTEAGNPMNFPVSDGTGETGEIVGENVSATSLDVAFTSAPLNTFKFSSKTVTVPIELLQDSMVDIEAFVRMRLVTRLGRIQNTKFTLGSGTGEPFGAVTQSGVGVTCTNSTSQVTAVIYDSLVNLVHSLDAAYRYLGNCRWMMNDASLAVIRKIKDANNRPILVPGYESLIPGQPGGAPDQLLGYPIQVNQDVAVMAAGAKSLLFGDFSYYYIRDALDVQIQRYTDSAFARLGQVGFQAWMRSGGNLLDPTAIKVLVNAAS